MGKKILIVDDSKTFRQQLSFTLGKSGFEVIEAEDGVDGIAKLKGNPGVALIISDVNMPNMNGLEMLEAIKKDASFANLPVIMLTTEGGVEMIERAKKASAKGWLVKPFLPDQLVSAATKMTA